MTAAFWAWAIGCALFGAGLTWGAVALNRAMQRQWDEWARVQRDLDDALEMAQRQLATQPDPGRWAQPDLAMWSEAAHRPQARP